MVNFRITRFDNVTMAQAAYSSRQEIFKKFLETSTWIRNNSNRINEILRPIAGIKSISHEIEGSLIALDGALKEVTTHNPCFINQMGVFHSSNALLYEYTIHCIIPTAFVSKVLIRPSSKVLAETLKLHEEIIRNTSLPIECFNESQKDFIDRVKSSEAIMFSGTHSNALEVMNKCNSKLFFFAGAGTNPFVIGENQNVSKVVSEMIEARMLNSGQDCVCSNIFFIPNTESKQWINELSIQLSELKVSPAKFKIAESNRIIYDNVFQSNSSFFSKHRSNIYYGGNIDYANSIINPTIFYFSIGDIVEPLEWFSPVFYLVGYSNSVDVREWLLRPKMLKKAMYLSDYGFGSICEKLSKSYIILNSQSVLDVEHPNKRFGGYGQEASFVAIDNNIHAKPYLLSEEVNKVYGSLEFTS